MSKSSPAELDEQIRNARLYRASQQALGKEVSVRSLVTDEAWSRIEDLSAQYVQERAETLVTDDTTTTDPLAAAQRASDARYGKGIVVPMNERALAFSTGSHDPDDHYQALVRKYAGAK